MMDKIWLYLRLAELVFQIADSAASAETKYEFIFDAGLCRSLNQIFRLEYYDPDTSYEEDVAAFVAALREKVANLPTGVSEDVVDLARQVTAEGSPTDSVGQLARLFARKVVEQHDELVQLRSRKDA